MGLGKAVFGISTEDTFSPAARRTLQGYHTWPHPDWSVTSHSNSLRTMGQKKLDAEQIGECRVLWGRGANLPCHPIRPISISKYRIAGPSLSHVFPIAVSPGLACLLPCPSRLQFPYPTVSPQRPRTSQGL